MINQQQFCKMSDLTIPTDDPLRNDKLHRVDLINHLYGRIKDTAPPYVMSLNGPWGTGKTTLLKMMMARMDIDKGIPYVYFNAWEFDWAGNPLIALTSAIEDAKCIGTDKESAFQSCMKTAKQVCPHLAKRLLVYASKSLTGGALDIVEEAGKIKQAVSEDTESNLVDEFTAEKKALRDFKSALAKAIEALQDGDIPKKLVVFIDELDRCRPTFAVELLERVKHVFDSAGIIFVFALDEGQLEACVRKVYGPEIEPKGYLRRFFDYKSTIPELTTGSVALTHSFIDRLGDNLIPDETSKKTFAKSFTAYANLMELTLREREKCLSQIGARLSQFDAPHELRDTLTSFCLALHGKDRELFNKFTHQDVTYDQVFSFISGLPRFGDLDDTYKALMQAFLILSGKQNADDIISRIAEQADADNPDREQQRKAEHLYHAISSIVRDPTAPDFEMIASWIDVANR